MTEEKKANPLTARMNVVSAAAAAGIVTVELDAIEREAALKLPRKQAMRDLARVLQAKLDAALLHAIRHQLQREPTEADLGGGDFEVWECKEEGYEGDIYALRGEPLLWAGPVLLRPGEDELGGYRSLVILNGAPAIDLSQVGAEGE